MKEKKTNKYSQNPIIFVCHSLGGLCWNLDLWGAAMPPEAGTYWWQPEAHGAFW